MGFMNRISTEIHVWSSRILQLISDYIRGLDFLIPVNSERSGLDPKVSFRSSPSGNKYLRNVLLTLNIKTDDSILDIGCGKGSALRIISEFRFKKIDGLELSEKLAQIATTNYSILKEKRVSIFNVNAIEFNKYSDYSFFYLNNPFPSEIMKKVMSKIELSAKSSPRNITLIYDNPVCHNDIIGNGNFQKISEFPDEWGNRIYLYCSHFALFH
jgi:SAM-dependent methyltransferase